MASSQKVVNANSQKNNGGSIAFVGTNNTKFNNVPYNQLATQKKNGSTVPDTGMTNKLVSGNALASMTAGSYIIRSYSPSTQAIPGSDTKHRRPYNFDYSVRTARFINPAGATGGWKYDTGKLIQGAPASGSSDTFATQGTTNYPTRAVPGRYTFLQSGKSTTTGSYEAKKN